MKKSVENLVSEETTSNAADTAEKVKEESEKLADRAATKVKQMGGQVDSRDREVKEPTGDVEEPSRKAEDEPRTPSMKPSNEHDATVQEGKSFAEAAAEGVPEEDMGESKVVDEPEEYDAVNVDGDEGVEGA